MPIYDYTCSACRRRTEFIHGINEPGPRFCPACGAEGTLRKDISSPAVHFKGSGWAKKDRSAPARKASQAAADGAGDATGTGSGKEPEGSSKTDSGAPAEPSATAATSSSSAPPSPKTVERG